MQRIARSAMDWCLDSVHIFLFTLKPPRWANASSVWLYHKLVSSSVLQLRLFILAIFLDKNSKSAFEVFCPLCEAPYLDLVKKNSFFELALRFMISLWRYSYRIWKLLTVRIFKINFLLSNMQCNMSNSRYLVHKYSLGSVSPSPSPPCFLRWRHSCPRTHFNLPLSTGKKPCDPWADISSDVACLLAHLIYETQISKSDGHSDPLDRAV